MVKTLLSVALLFLSTITFGQPLIVDTVTKTPLELANVQFPILSPEFSSFSLVSKDRLSAIQNKVPLTYNEVVQKYIDDYSTRKDQMGKMLGLSEYYFPIFEKALKAFNIPDEIKYLPIIESSMDPQAVSKSGAIGLWQFMQGTAKGYRLKMDDNEDQRKDPIHASYAAAAYFRDAYEEFGDWLLALAAYNCGTGAVSRAIVKAGSRDYWEIRSFLPLQTRNYIPAFIAAVYTMKYAGEHQILAKKNPFTCPIDTILVGNVVSLSSLASAMHVDETLLTYLNPSYKQKVVFGSALLPKRIVIPKTGVENFAAIYDVLNNSSASVIERIAIEEKLRKQVHK